MKELRLLVKHEIINHIISYKFYLSLIFPVLITIFTVIVQLGDYKDSINTYHQESTSNSKIIRNFRTYSEFNIPVLLKPQIITIFNNGDVDKIGNSSNITVTSLPEFEKKQQISNPFLDIFTNLDIITIIEIILSIFIIFIVSDTVTTERENEVLKLLFIGHLSRSKYFIAKYLGNLITFIIPVFFIYLLSITIIWFHPYVSLTKEFYIKVLFLFFSSILFISSFIIISLIISSISENSSNAIIRGLVIWFFLTLVYPNTIKFIFNETGKFPDEELLNKEIAQINNELEEELWNNVIWSTKPMNVSFFTGFSYAGLPQTIGLTEKYNFKVFEDAVSKNIPILLEKQQHILNLKNDFYVKSLNQNRKYDRLHYLLPGYLFKSSTNEISKTGYEYYYEEIYPKLLTYRNEIINYLKKKGALGIRYFTQIEKHEMKDRFNEYSNQMIEKYNETNYPKINTDDMPIIQLDSKVSIPEQFYLSFFQNIILILVCFISFHKLKII